MKKLLRVCIGITLVVTVGGFQYAQPFFLNSLSLPAKTSSAFTLDMSYTKITAPLEPIRITDYDDIQQGSLLLQKDNDESLILSPLLRTQVNINVTGLLARARVTQRFTNQSDTWVNGIYVFPLPEDAAVDHLEMQIGERLIVGQIQPTKRAEKIYQQAKHAGKKASLLEQHRPNLFKTSIANIGPGESIQISIEYQQSINYADNIFSIRFPTTLTERYLPSPPSEQPEIISSESGWSVSQSKPPEQQHTVSINVRLHTGFELGFLHSEFHPIVQNQIQPGIYTTRLKHDTIANQDFVLSWQATSNQHPQAANFVQQTEQGHYGMVMLMPPDPRHDIQRLAREVIFIIDTSGSMSGDSIQQARNSLSYAIDALHPQDAFNLIDFDSSARQLWPSSKVASQANKLHAGRYIRRLRAQGGTEMLPALDLALAKQSPQSERLRQVIFVTDGAVGNETELFTYIQNNLQQSRLFTVGIGSSPNSFFMTEAARMGRGSFTYIGSVDAVQTQMKHLFEKLTHPVLANLHINFSNDVEFYPQKIPDLYKGQPMMISYKSANRLNSLTLSGSQKNSHWQKSMSLRTGAAQSGLDVLWARRKIAQLNRDKMRYSDHDTVNQQILKVAMQHHIVSTMTSLVAVDRVPTALGASIDSQVKSALPKGQLHGTLPQTATSAQLQMLFALLLMGLGLCTFIFTPTR